jgi:hypothetical protein
MRRWEVEKMRRWEAMEFGIGTRRRPIGRDYAAAKDAECGRIEAEKLGRWEGGKR